MSAPERENVGFEALLRPLQDVLCKDWEVTLTEYLEQYLAFLKGNGEPSMNFAEAALLLQNSTQFYCKRVDLVFNFMIKLIDKLQKTNSVDETEGEGKVKKKKHTRVLQNEEMQVLDSIYADNNIEMKSDKKSKGNERKTIVLNTSMKIPCKPNTSYLIFATPGMDIGYKSDFRLNWRINSDGLLQEDFSESNKTTHFIPHTEISHSEIDLEREDNDDGIGGDIELDGNPEVDLEPQLSEPVNCNPPSSPFQDFPQEYPPEPEDLAPVNNKQKKEVPNKKENPWAPFSINFNFNLLKFKKKRIFKLPKSIIEWNNKRKRGENEKKILGTESESYVFHSTLVGKAGLVNPVEFKLQEEKNWKNLINLRRRLGTVYVRRAGKDFDGDFLGFSPKSDESGFDDEIDDIDLNNDGDINDDDDDCNPVPFTQLDLTNVEVVHPIDVRDIREENPQDNGYYTETLQAHEKYKEAKRAFASSSAEVTKRVAAWHEKLQPILAAAERRSNFDIQQYGTSILNKFPESEENSVLSFRSLTEGQPKVEICRYFLSTLVLANTYNVEIVKTKEGDFVKDCLDVKLLSRVRHHEEINENIGEAAKESGN